MYSPVVRIWSPTREVAGLALIAFIVRLLCPSGCLLSASFLPHNVSPRSGVFHSRGVAVHEG
ncbi:hypothetical protein E2C01_090954 [Portunus trituberculatus]|uniref:Uncharacterized protein n=1 Tax=Portunus trituberculatus TaxID=210409 RepID=A0A5B7JLN8_PORTR|nr:hypothetical protein [Portunus trituberculatus]